MNHIAWLILGHRKLTVSILTLLVLFCSWRAAQLRENLSFETLYLSHSPEIAFSKVFSETFENVNDMVAIAVTGHEVFSPQCLGAVDRITKRTAKLQDVDLVHSLTNAQHIRALDGSLDVSPFCPALPKTNEEAAAMKAQALANPLFRGRLVSDDGRYLAIVVHTADLIGRPADSRVAQLLGELGSEDAVMSAHARQELLQLKERLRAAVRKENGVPRLVEQFLGSDQGAQDEAAAELGLLGSTAVRVQSVEDRRELIADIENIVSAELPAGYQAYVTGTNVIERDYAQILRHDKAVFHVLTAILLALGLLVSFWNAIDVIAGLVVIAIAAVCALGVVQLLGAEIDIINSVIVVLVMTVGSSNVIHLMLSFRDERSGRSGRGAAEAAAHAMVRSVGFACLMCSLTTAAGFFSLWFAEIGTISSFGLNMAAAVLTTSIVTLTAMTLYLSARREEPASRMPPFWSKCSDALISGCRALALDRRPLGAALFAAVALVSCYGWSRLYAETHAVAEVPEDSPTKISIRAMENLAGWLGFEVSIRSRGQEELLSADNLAKVQELTKYLKSQPETLRAWSITDYLEEMNSAAESPAAVNRLPYTAEGAEQLLLLYSFSVEGRNEIEGLISDDRKWIRVVGRLHDVGAGPYLRLRDRVETLGRQLFKEKEIEVRVTSEMYLCHAAMDRIVSDLARSMIGAFLLVGALMAFSLRSFRLGLVSVLPNVFPLFVTIGFMGLTGIELRVGTIVVFAMGLGIAVDDTVHFLLRYRLERQSGKDGIAALERTYRRTGRAMLLTSLVLILGFSGTFSATFRSIWQMGVLNAFLLATALLADLILTPMLVHLLDHPANYTATETVPPDTAGASYET